MDLDYREMITLGPLAVLAILFGIFPKPVLDLSAARWRSCSTTTRMRSTPRRPPRLLLR